MDFVDSRISSVLDKLETQSALEKSRKVSVEPEDRMLAITKETGELINMILRLKKAKNALEIGMSTGYSTLWSAEAIQENSGKIFTIEKNAKKIKRARDNFSEAGVSEMIQILEGEAIQIVKELSNKERFKDFFDFVLIDADKESVTEYFDLVLPMTAIGGIIITDNMLYPEKYRDIMKEFSEHIKKYQNVRTITSPIGNGEEITVKIE